VKIPVAQKPNSSVIFTGRKDILDKLQKIFFRRVDSRRGHVVEISGPPGCQSGKPENTYLCLIILIFLNFENKENKESKRDFQPIFDLYFIQIKRTVFLSTIRMFKYNKELNLKKEKNLCPGRCEIAKKYAVSSATRSCSTARG
jgi:hypothetical protein